MSTSFFAELVEQPDVILRCLERAQKDLVALAPLIEQLNKGNFQRIIFSGMGGSLAAANTCALRLIERGIPAFVVETSELLYYQRALLEPGALLILISQSGYSVEVVHLLKEIAPTVPIIGITNDPTSTLGHRSTVQLTLQAGVEQTVSTKTYTSTIVLLHLLGTALLGDKLSDDAVIIRRAAESIRVWLPRWEKRILEAMQVLNEPKFVIFLGRGFSRASALTGALIVKETAKFPTDGMTSGQFRHGPIEVVEQGVTVVIFSSPGRTDALHGPLSERVKTLGGQVISIGAALPGAFHIETPDFGEVLAPLIEIIPVQYLAAALALQRGFEVGTFRYSQKVTVVE